MTKRQIINKLQQMKWLDKHWRLKDFYTLETEEKIIFSYNHGDMGLVDKIIYYKNDGFTKVYELNNYYGSTDLITSLYL